MSRAKLYFSYGALAYGIREFESEILGDAVYPGPENGFATAACFTLGVDAHRTREAAVVAAEAQRQDQLRIVRMELAKLEALSFSTSDVPQGATEQATAELVRDVRLLDGLRDIISIAASASGRRMPVAALNKVTGIARQLRDLVAAGRPVA